MNIPPTKTERLSAKSVSDSDVTQWGDFQEGGALNAGRCEACGHHVIVGHVVTLWDDVGEVHWDCVNPYNLPEIEPAGTEGDPKAYVMIGFPLRAQIIASLASRPPTEILIERARSIAVKACERMDAEPRDLALAIAMDAALLALQASPTDGQVRDTALEENLRNDLWESLGGDDCKPATWAKVTTALHRHYAAIRALKGQP